MNMNYEELEQLFYANELETCIAEGEKSLASSPDDLDVLFLMAVAHHDLAYREGHEEAYVAIQKQVIPYLRRILTIDPSNNKALYNILNYPLDNQYVLWQIARPQKHITEENKDEFIAYAQKLLADNDSAPYGFDFLIKIYESLAETEHLLATIDRGIAFFKERFADNRDVLDKNISYFWLKKIYVLDYSKLATGAEIIKMIADQIDRYVSHNNQSYLDLAEIAYENQAVDLSLKIMMKLIEGDNSDTPTQEGLVKWYHRFEGLINQSYSNPDVFYYQMIIERNYADMIGKEEDFYFRHAGALMQSNPKEYGSFHFAGTYLYEHGDYIEAINLLDQACTLNLNVYSWRRMVESKFLAHQLITSSVPTFKDKPRDLYNAGVDMANFIVGLNVDEETKMEFRKIELAIYKQAYKAFHRYFDDGEFDSDTLGDRHNMAMNCNNYAIVLAAFQRYADAAEIAQEGLQYSEFPELHNTLVDALIKGEDYEGANVAIHNFFSVYNEDMVYYYNYIQHRASQIVVHEKLGLSEDIKTAAEELLFEIYGHYNENPDISDYDFRDFEYAKNLVEGVLYNHFADEPTEVRRRYYAELGNRFPDEANPQYQLMQINNEAENYAEVNKAARLYMENKRSFLLNDFDKAKTIYMIVKSHYLLAQYREGAAMFEEYNQFVGQTLEASEYTLWLSYGIQLQDKMNNKALVEQYTDQYQAIYDQEGWGYDELSENVYLAKAHAQYQSGNLKEAHRTLNYVLSFDNPAALAKEYKNSWKKPSLFSKFF